MSEVALDYNREIFPVAGILEDLTRTVQEQGLAPLQAYEVFERELVAHGLGRRILDYGSTSITTGGHARIPGRHMGEVIAANTKTAREIVALLHAGGSIEANEMLLSVDLGKTGWGQAGFMSYWLLSIAGPDVRALANRPGGFTDFERIIERSIQEHEVDLGIMGSGKLDRDVRRPEYQKFTAAHVSALRRSGVDCRPVRRLISLVDPDISLGCEAESTFARDLGIPKMRVTPVKPASIDEAVPIPMLREDLHVIQAYGGRVCVAAAGSMLTLQREPEYVDV